jgi:hypothetical protein
MRKLFPKAFLVTWIAVGARWAGTLHAQVAGFVQVNLVSDIPGLATITDPQLVNPWGVSHSSTSPFYTWAAHRSMRSESFLRYSGLEPMSGAADVV